MGYWLAHSGVCQLLVPMRQQQIPFIQILGLLQHSLLQYISAKLHPGCSAFLCDAASPRDWPMGTSPTAVCCELVAPASGHALARPAITPGCRLARVGGCASLLHHLTVQSLVSLAKVLSAEAAAIGCCDQGSHATDAATALCALKTYVCMQRLLDVPRHFDTRRSQVMCVCRDPGGQ